MSFLQGQDFRSLACEIEAPKWFCQTKFEIMGPVNFGLYLGR